MHLFDEPNYTIFYVTNVVKSSANKHNRAINSEFDFYWMLIASVLVPKESNLRELR